jgi:hypothetical protein
MPNITADKIIGHDIYAGGSIQALDKNFKPGKAFTSGQKIGNVYSWIEQPGGALYWMVYETDQDYNNFNPIYIKHEPGKVLCPDLPGIIAEINRKKEAQAIDEKGALAYYAGKYLPWIIGAVALAIILPSLRKR